MKRTQSNKDLTIQNAARFAWWCEKLKDYYLTAYKWEGLPFDETDYYQIEMYLNEILLVTGSAGLAYIDDYIPVIGAVTSCEGYNWWGGASKYILTNKTDSKIFNKERIAICYNSPTKRPMLYTIEHYAQLLAEIDGIEGVNLKGQNTPAIIRSPHGQELTYVNTYEQIAGHKPVVFGREDLLDDDKAWYYPPKADYVCDKLELLKHDVLNDFFNELGITSKTIEKRAQLITDEVNIDRETISLMKNSFLDAREKFAESANKTFGLDVSVKINIDAMPAEFVGSYSSNDAALSYDDDNDDNEGGDTDEV